MKNGTSIINTVPIMKDLGHIPSHYVNTEGQYTEYSKNVIIRNTAIIRKYLDYRNHLYETPNRLLKILQTRKTLGERRPRPSQAAQFPKILVELTLKYNYLVFGSFSTYPKIFMKICSSFFLRKTDKISDRSTKSDIWSLDHS